MAIEDYPCWAAAVIARYPSPATRKLVVQTEGVLRRLRSALNDEGMGDLARELPDVSVIGPNRHGRKAAKEEGGGIEENFYLD